MSDQSALGLGHIITSKQERDAVHVAVIPVVAGEMIRPGQHVGVHNSMAWLEAKTAPIGIADPFLRRPAMLGQTFWLWLYPGSITSLRHSWTHPALPNEES